MEEKLEVCDFCGKNQNEVKKIIKGDNACICNECISICCEILDEDNITYHQSTKIMECSFCGKSKDDVVKLISGPDCYICDECVQKFDGAKLFSSNIEGTCSFCGKSKNEVNMVAENGNYRICNECMELCKEILAEESLAQNNEHCKCSNCCKDIVDVDKAVSIGDTILCKTCIEYIYKMTHKKLNWAQIIFVTVVVVAILAKFYKMYSHLGLN